MTNISGLSVIGYFVWWTINNQRIKRDDLQKSINDLGIKNYKGQPFKIPEIKPRSAFLKAVREIRGAYKNRGILIRKIKKDADSYVFGLVDEHVYEKLKTLDYSHNATMTFHPCNGHLTVDKAHRAFDLIKQRYEEYADYLNSDDIREILLNILNQIPTVSVRQRGGIYFVPEKYAEMVDNLEKLVASLPGGGEVDLEDVGVVNGSYLAIAPQIDTERSKKSIYKAFVAGLKSRMKTFEKELEEEGLSQKHALKERLKEFKQMRAEINFYKDALEFQVEDLGESLTALTNKIQKKLMD